MAPNKQDTAKSLLASIHSDLSDTQQLLTLLQEERSCLDNNQHGALTEFSQKKETLTQQLDQRATQRHLALAPFNLQCGNRKEWLTSLAFFKDTDSGIALQNSWEQLEILLKECDIAMQVNEKIIAALLHSARQFISVLTGHTKDAQTYDAGGKTSSHTLSNEFISA